MAVEEEVHQGFVMDIACARKAPADELLDRASHHTTACGLMGHCVESGFVLVGDDGRIQLIEPAATTAVVKHLLETDVERGFRLLIRRERDGDEMKSVDIARADATFGATGVHERP